MAWATLESASLHFPIKKLCGFGQYASRASFFAVVRLSTLKTQFEKKFQQVAYIPEISVLGNRKINDTQEILFMKTKVIDQFWETENRGGTFVRA